MRPVSQALRQLGTVKRGMPFSLHGNTVEVNLALILAINPEEDNQLGVKAQLVPIPQSLALPTNLHLRLWSNGELIKDVSPTHLFRYLEIPYFRGNPGETFRLEAQLDRDAFQASFQL